MNTPTTTLIDGLGFPECPRWHDDALWFSDMLANRVMRVDAAGSAQLVAELQDTPIGLGWTLDHHLLVVSASACQLLRLDGAALVTAADLSTLVSHLCNDLVVDRRGNAYVGSLGFSYGEEEAVRNAGSLLHVAPDGSARIVAEALDFPNGMVITPDGTTLIVAESYAARLTAFTIADDGSLTQRRAWAQFEDSGDYTRAGQLSPDGITLDADGCVWLASPNTRELLRVREGGEIVQRIVLDHIPLACMLGGADGKTLYLTTTESLDFSRDTHGRIETLRVDVPGAGLP